MNQEELLEHHKDLCGDALNLMTKKNHDYAGADGESPFANFERSEAMGICTTEAAMLVRMTDKMSRLSTYVDCGELKVENEGYKDAVVDLINYLVLFSGYVDSTQKKTKSPKKTPKFPKRNS